MTKTKIILLVLISIFTASQKIKAQDWPNLEKYKSANEKLESPKSDENRVVFMGNSITESWPQTFFHGKPYVNRGISGQTTPQMLLRFRQDVINLQPKVVLILAGTNDIAKNTGPITLEEIRDNILSMVELAKANNITPVVCSVLPAYDYPWREEKLQPNIKIPKLNGMLKSMAANQKVPYLDYFSEMADDRNGLPKELTTDEVHLTPKGYAILGKMAEAQIAKVLKR